MCIEACVQVQTHMRVQIQIRYDATRHYNTNRYNQYNAIQFCHSFHSDGILGVLVVVFFVQKVTSIPHLFSDTGDATTSKIREGVLLVPID